MSTPEQNQDQTDAEHALIPLAQAMVTKLVDGAAWSARSIVLLRRVIVGLIAVAVVLATVVGYLLDKDIRHTNSSALHAQANQIQTLTNANSALLQQIKDEQTAQKQYTDARASVACKALVLLTKTPVAKPTDAASNPSREELYQLYEALVYWSNADHCTATVHQIKPPVK